MTLHDNDDFGTDDAVARVRTDFTLGLTVEDEVAPAWGVLDPSVRFDGDYPR